MIIDIHSHILPKLDDGAENLRESIDMLHIAVQEGIKAIVVTPHYEVGMDELWLNRYKDAYSNVYKYINDNNLPIKLYVGNEVFYSDSIIEEHKSDNLATLNNTKYILIEFPIYECFDSICRAVRNLQYMGFWPIIAHVERYINLNDIKKIKELVELGAYLQVNASTVVGKVGFTKRVFITKLIKEGLIDFIATDAHGSKFRRPLIRDAYNFIAKKCGNDIAKKLCTINPEKVLKGEKIRGKNHY